MTKTLRIYGVDVEFTDKAPSEDGYYWILDGEVQDGVSVENGYIETSAIMPSETNWLWSSRLVPSSKALAALTAITSGHFYQSSCRGGEMERLMNQAIESLSAVNTNQASQ